MSDYLRTTYEAMRDRLSDVYQDEVRAIALAMPVVQGDWTRWALWFVQSMDSAADLAADHAARTASRIVDLSWNEG